jgi:hypothetical protein
LHGDAWKICVWGVKEVVQANGGANDEDVWRCIDGPKGEGRTRQNRKVGEIEEEAGGFG